MMHKNAPKTRAARPRGREESGREAHAKSAKPAKKAGGKSREAGGKTGFQWLEKSAKVASNAWKTGKTWFQWLENPAKAKGRGTRMSEGKREGNFQKNVHGAPKKCRKMCIKFLKNAEKCA